MGDTDSLRDATPTRRPSDAPPATDDPDDAVAIGDCLGRYTVRGKLGEGGMGEVFEGHDPELQREVALKLLRPAYGGASAATRARFQREAQAMARLNHPNVVAVYDVGTIRARVFVAMELVRGPTLSAWIADGPHPWRRVVDVFLAAGRGLAAAHAAGIVHRDFKPGNVILGDRTRVVDFGLARALGEADPAIGAPAGSLLDHTVTQTGHALGTPRYMAPEQRDGGAVTALADQYAFCVALDEALAGVRAPRSLAALTARGRQADPTKRFPSMEALLAELGRDRARTRNRVLAGAGAATLVASVAALLAHRAADPPCASAGARLAGIWDASRRAAVHAAFAATGLAYAEDAWRDARGILDGYATRWADMANESCRATRVEGRQSDTLMDLRTACLERRRAMLDELTAVWARGLDAAAIQRASSAARSLPVLAECADARALTERSPLPADPAAGPPIAAARAQVDRVRALTLAHHWPEARQLAAPARAAAEATGWAPVRAEAAFAEADVLSELADPAAADRLVEASRLAGEAHDDQLQAQALVELVAALAPTAGGPARALAAADAASGVIARVPGDPALRARLLTGRATALQVDGKLDAARQAIVDAEQLAPPGTLERIELDSKLATIETRLGHTVESRRIGEANLAAATALLGPSSPRVAQIAAAIGKAAFEAGDNTAAVAASRRALAIMERAAGPESVPVAKVLVGLGVAELLLAQLDAANTHLERALAIEERVLGPDDPLVALTIGDLVNLRRKQGRMADGVALATRAVALQRKVRPDSPELMDALVQLGSVLEMKGDLAAAVVPYREAMEIGQRTIGPSHADTITAMISVAEIFAQTARCAEAIPLLDASLAGLDNPDRRGSPDMPRALTARASCDLAQGRAAAAVPRLARALALLDAGKLGPTEHGSARAELARALWATGQHATALAAAHTATRELASDADGAHDLAGLRSWLAAHEGR